MKKHLVKVLSFVMALTMVLGVFGPYAVFAATDAHDHADVECDHVWGDIVVNDISCNEKGEIVNGLIYRECTKNCGAKKDVQKLSEADIYAILGVGCQQHKAYTYTLIEAPDCTNDGELTFTCAVCGKGYGKGDVKIPVKALGHIGANGTAWDSAWTVTKAETCIEDGVKTRKCDRCGYSETGSIPKIDHKIKTGVDKDGNPIYVSAYEKINPATCASCARKVPADTVIDQESTCYQEGWTYKHCTICHDVQKFPAEKTAHNWKKIVLSGDAWEYDYEVKIGTAMCDDNGDGVNDTTNNCACCRATFYFKVCADCGAREEDTSKRIEAAGHVWESKVWDVTAMGKKESDFCEDGGWKMVVDPTKAICDPTSVNYYVRECTKCNCEEKVNYFVNAHTDNKYVCDVDADNCTDCTHTGRKLICSVCGRKASDAKHANHNLVQGDLVSAATCIKKAVYKYECNCPNCDYSENKEVGAVNPNNHAEANGATGLQVTLHQPATCKTEGRLKGWCNDCQTAVDQILPVKTEHTAYITTTPAKAATCIATGTTLGGYCQECGHEDIAKVIPYDKTAKGHELADCEAKTIVEIGATCAHGSFKAVVWNKCGLQETVAIDDAARDTTKHYYVTIEWIADAVNGGAQIAAIKQNAFDVKTSALVPPTCNAVGNHEYTYCAGCDTILSINYTSCVGGATYDDCKLSAKEHEKAFKDYIGTSRLENGNKLTIAQLKHDFSVITKPALKETCTTPGNVAEIYCQNPCCRVDGNKVYKVVDGVVQDGHTIAPHGFDATWENKAPVAPNCTTDGKLAGIFCSKCTDTAAADCTYCNGSSDKDPALGHTVVKQNVTLRGTGYKVEIYKCERCYDYLKGTAVVNAPGEAYNGHIWYGVYTIVPVAAACTHANGTYEVTVDATCEENGYTEKYCNDCDDVVSTTTIYATGHRNADDNVIYLDCQNYSIYLDEVCTKCNKTAGVDIHHNLVPVFVGSDCAKDANAKSGAEYYECTDCKAKFNNADAEASLNATFPGYIKANVKYDATVDVVAPTTALYVETVKYVPATSTSDGSWTWLCVCGKEHTQVLKFNYVLTFDVAIKPYTGNNTVATNFVNAGLVEVLVSVSGEDVLVNGFDYRLGYNNSLLTFVDAEIVYDSEAAEGVQNDFDRPTVKDNATNVAVMTTAKTGVAYANISGEKVPFIKYIFKLSEGANAIAKTDITLLDAPTDFVSPAKVTIINNQLTAGAAVKLMGDLDGDNNVTLSDLVKFRALSNENGYNNAADFNADGAVDFYDLVALNNFVASNHTVADYYEMLGIDINAEIEGYNYGDLDGDGDSDLLDAAAFKANFVAILNIASNYKTILGAANVDSILAAAKA